MLSFWELSFVLSAAELDLDWNISNVKKLVVVGACCAQVRLYGWGFSDAQRLRDVANEQAVLARNLGATDAVILQARQDVDTAFSTAAAFTSPREACGSLMGELAFATWPFLWSFNPFTNSVIPPKHRIVCIRFVDTRIRPRRWVNFGS